MKVRKALLPNEASFIQETLKLIDLSHYPDAAEIEDPSDQWFVYEEDRQILGIIAADRIRGEIKHLAVLPESRRRGVGKQLVETSISYLRELNCPRIWTQVRTNNKPSQGLFESIGFDKSPHILTTMENQTVKLYKYTWVNGKNRLVS